MKPGFVIIGVDTGDGLVTMLASDELTHSHLSHEMRMGERSTSRVDVEMQGYTVAKGATFREAMTNLAAQWQPKERTTTSVKLEAGVPRLPAGSERDAATRLCRD